MARKKMTIRAFEMGHPVYLTSDEVSEDGVMRTWRYADTDELVDDSPRRKCVKCHKYATEDGHDPCIANLPGVKHACCGHGVADGYAMFDDGRLIQGKFQK